MDKKEFKYWDDDNSNEKEYYSSEKIFYNLFFLVVYTAINFYVTLGALFFLLNQFDYKLVSLKITSENIFIISLVWFFTTFIISFILYYLSVKISLKKFNTNFTTWILPIYDLLAKISTFVGFVVVYGKISGGFPDNMTLPGKFILFLLITYPALAAITLYNKIFDKKKSK